MLLLKKINNFKGYKTMAKDLEINVFESSSFYHVTIMKLLRRFRDKVLRRNSMREGTFSLSVFQSFSRTTTQSKQPATQKNGSKGKDKLF